MEVYPAEKEVTVSVKADRNSITKIDSGYVKQYDAYVERQHKKKKRLIRRLSFFIAVTVLIFGGLLSYHVQQRAMLAQKQEEYQELQSELSKLNHKKTDLEEEIQLLNDEDYVLQIARTNYFFSKEGEIIFKMPDNNPSY